MVVLVLKSVDNLLEVFVMHFHKDFFLFRIQMPEILTANLYNLVFFEPFTKLNLFLYDQLSIFNF